MYMDLFFMSTFSDLSTFCGPYLHQLHCSVVYTKMQVFNKWARVKFNLCAPSTILVHASVLNVLENTRVANNEMK